MKFKFRLPGKAEIIVRGLNLNKLLAKLIKAEIKILSAAFIDTRSLSITVPAKDKKAALKIIADCGLKHEEPKLYGASSALAAALKRPAMFIGVLLIIAGLYAFNAFIWKVEISGNVNIPDYDIITALKDNGIRTGVMVKNIDERALSDKLFKSLEHALFVDIKIERSILTVHVSETINKIPDDDTLKSDDIVAARDGIIERIIVNEGTAVVKKGQIVKKGQLLVAGYEISMVGDEEVRTPVRAVAKVYAKVVYSKNDYSFPKGVKYVRTGEKATAASLQFRGLYFMQKEPEHEFTFYEEEITKEYISKNLFSSLLIIRHTVYELKAENYESDTEGIARRLADELKMTVMDGDVIIREYSLFNEYEGTIRITAIIEAEGLIGIRLF